MEAEVCSSYYTQPETQPGISEVLLWEGNLGKGFVLTSWVVCVGVIHTSQMLPLYTGSNNCGYSDNVAQNRTATRLKYQVRQQLS